MAYLRKGNETVISSQTTKYTRLLDSLYFRFVSTFWSIVELSFQIQHILRKTHRSFLLSHIHGADVMWELYVDEKTSPLSVFRFYKVD